MCISPQSTRINITNFFKNKQKISSQKLNQRENYNKLSTSRKLSSRNIEKPVTTKINTKKLINNSNINPFLQFSSNNNSTCNNANNIINKSHNFIYYNYENNTPQSIKPYNQDISANLFLNTNNSNKNVSKISNIEQKYFKLNHNRCNNYTNIENNNFNINNFSYNGNNNNNSGSNKITKIEINNINYNNGKNIIIKNLSETTKDSSYSNRLNKDIIFPITSTNISNIKYNKNNSSNRMIKSLKYSSVQNPIFRHFSSNSTTNILHNHKISDYNNPNALSNTNININTTNNTNSNLKQNHTNINFYSKVEKDNNSKSKKNNTNFNEININKSNISNKKIEINLKKNYNNNYKNDNINNYNSMNENLYTSNTNIKNNYIINNLLLNDINITGNNDSENKFNHSNKINYNNYKIKSTRNNSYTNIKTNNMPKRKITYSSYDLKNEEKKEKCPNNNKDNKKKREGILYRKNSSLKKPYNSYFYDSNKNIFKDISPEENHFQTITFLQKMKLNNCMIK